MKINKNDVVAVLKTISEPGEGENIIDSGAITHIMIFGDQIDLDVTLANPSLQARKKLEVTILEVLHQKVYEKAKIKSFFPNFQSILMQVAKTGAINKKTASRKISKISKKISN